MEIYTLVKKAMRLKAKWTYANPKAIKLIYKMILIIKQHPE